MSEYTIGVANRSDLGFKWYDNNNPTFTMNSILTRPYQIYKMMNEMKAIDVDITGK